MNDADRSALIASAGRLGVSPLDLATVISYETGGTFNPSIRGGAGNRHIGLIQFGPNEQRQYGANQGQSFSEQLPAVEGYLTGRGFKPGMGRLDLYSTINAGRPGLYHASDAGNGGAPGTVADKVRDQMGAHEAKAQAFLGGSFSPPTSARPMSIPGQPTGNGHFGFSGIQASPAPSATPDASPEPASMDLGKLLAMTAARPAAAKPAMPAPAPVAAPEPPAQGADFDQAAFMALLGLPSR